MLELVNLTEHCHKAVDTYSSGMRQRFGIAQVLLTNPKVIIVDEPTAGLDPAERNRFYSILHQLTDSAIVILSTHSVGDVTNLCADMGILNRGTLLARGKPDELVASIEHQIWHKSVSRNELKYRLRFVATWGCLIAMIAMGYREILGGEWDTLMQSGRVARSIMPQFRA
ncbi:ATP-binding cassette domain-containing protein [Pseudoalteromonas sp. HM-SA03]|uniref:ATP-binding cassette domain-containing protein n=1 Tax=Pseudoalteromonas sp. HM-SA03 TaxID=2029678 RepID=UPI0015955A83|nr:ATP-binding cassette domain-containing protein [Pseudoalteromonas sp. HM-SA03]